MLRTRISNSCIIAWGEHSVSSAHTIQHVSLPIVFSTFYKCVLTLKGNDTAGYIGSPITLANNSDLATIRWSKYQYNNAVTMNYICAGC